MAKLLPSIHYPATMVWAFAAFAALQAAGMPLIVSTLRNGIVSRGRRYLARAAANKSRHVATDDARGPNRPHFHGRRAAGVSAAPRFLFTYALIAPARALNLPTAALASRLADLDSGDSDGAGRRLPALLAASRRPRE